MTGTWVLRAHDMWAVFGVLMLVTGSVWALYDWATARRRRR